MGSSGDGLSNLAALPGQAAAPASAENNETLPVWPARARGMVAHRTKRPGRSHGYVHGSGGETPFVGVDHAFVGWVADSVGDDRSAYARRSKCMVRRLVASEK